MSGTVHFVFAIAALVFGAATLNIQKGNKPHRLLGYCYTASLLLVNSSALLIYEDSAAAGPFHVLAAVSLFTLISGFVPAFIRRPATSWLRLHAYFMSWSYVDLVAAGAAQLVTYFTRFPPWLSVGLSSTLIALIGGVLIHTQVLRVLVSLKKRELTT